jgi:hypothetical protein
VVAERIGCRVPALAGSTRAGSGVSREASQPSRQGALKAFWRGKRSRVPAVARNAPLNAPVSRLTASTPPVRALRAPHPLPPIHHTLGSAQLFIVLLVVVARPDRSDAGRPQATTPSGVVRGEGGWLPTHIILVTSRLSG